ncbi:MAG: sugar phosphate isomerase/epimerase [Firmicutes bacterium]|nr:sugar phosphate isomerase/epimerase [Bacillota bacterium]
MQIAVSMWSLHREFYSRRLDVVGFVKWAADAKADGVELLDVFWKDFDTEGPKVLDVLEKTNLKVGAYAVGNNFVIPDPEARAQQVKIITRGVDMAKYLNTKVVRVFAGDLAEGIAFDAARGWIVAGLREAAAYAKEHGIILALENHGLLAGKGDQVQGLIADVGSTALKATIDTGNFLLVDEEPTDAVKILAPLAGHVHFKDFRPANAEEAPSYPALSGKRFVGTIIDEGVVDTREILRLLQDSGYRGWLSVEFEGLEEEKIGASRSIANLAATLADL